MKPAAFDYLRSGDVGEALAALAEHGDEASILAGGQSLMTVLNMRLGKPALLIDISRLPELCDMRVEGGMLQIGAAVTQRQLEFWPELASRAPLLAQAISHVGHFQTRSRGTVCGSIAFADPSAELPLCLAILGGKVLLRTTRGQRTMEAQDFQIGVLTTALQPDEMIIAVRFPLARPGAGYAFYEMSARQGDFAIVAIAVEARRDGIRVGVGGVVGRPVVRDWPDLSGTALDDALNELAWELEARDDHRISASYRREVLRRLGRKTIEEAKACRS
jgi:2-furoyl-CoA dehydrogenase FAD binding subunit